jgi:hypothetical protein
MGPLKLSSQLSRLAQRILAGEVVFFVGAGFSIDSEGLSAARLIRRLLVRLHALDHLQAVPGTAFKRLAGMFSVKATLPEIAGKKAPVNQLAVRYYEINEWMCRAYGELVCGAQPASWPEFCQRLFAAEVQAAKDAETAAEADPDQVTRTWTWTDERFQALPEVWWDHSRGKLSLTDRKALGKLVFVQTLGFHDAEVMAGTPFPLNGDIAEVERSFRGRLRPRHHVLARFAREGFYDSVLTTNFDLLLEGALRLSGFGTGVPRAASSLTATQHFDVLASPQAFFQRGKAVQTFTVLKLHGCAGLLRTLHEQRLEATVQKTPVEHEQDKLANQFKYLPQLVYTYREIQNWRDDSWAADHLSTLLRTHTLVFAGYSTADPVMHNTFRGIYEEMARKTAESAHQDRRSATTHLPDNAPAYFFGFSNSSQPVEFHGKEVLDSASQAVGATPNGPLGPDHPNYLRFAPVWDKTSAEPHLDELLEWTQHDILRNQQAAALNCELPGLIARLFRRRPASECRQIHEAFEKLKNDEIGELERAANSAEARRCLRRILGWSNGFHLALRREWARGLLLASNSGNLSVVADLEHPLWYFPASERPSWTAWSAVLELALRRLARLAVEHWSGKPVPDGVETIEATPALRPTVFFRQHAAPTAPIVSLTLQLRGFDRPARRPDIPGHPARKVIWLFHEDALPWSNQKAAAGTGYPMGADCWCPQPSAEVIWNLALGGATPAIVPQLLVA